MLVNEFIIQLCCSFSVLDLFPWCFKGLYCTVLLSLRMGNVTRNRNWYQKNYCVHIDLLKCHLPFLTWHLIWTSPNLCRWVTTSTYSLQVSYWIFLVGLLVEGGKCLLQKRSMRREFLVLFSFHPFFSSSLITPPFPCCVPVMSCAVGDKNKIILIGGGGYFV